MPHYLLGWAATASAVVTGSLLHAGSLSKVLITLQHTAMSYVGDLTPSTSQCDLTWRQDLYQGNQGEGIRVDPNPI